MTLIRCCSSRLAINRLPRNIAHTHLARWRGLADKPQSPPVRYEPDPEASVANVQNEFIGHTVSAFKNLGKVLAYVGYGTLILGLVTATAFEGGHFWIERQMRMLSDEDAERWGWENDGWTGGDAGGTSPELGFYGRHAVRAAWFALHYGSGVGAVSTISRAHGGRGTGSLNVVHSDLEGARLYLEAAMARMRGEDGRVRMGRVGLELLERHAGVLEHIGTRAALARAREEYLQIMEGREGQRLAQARLAVKLGDLSERLGDGESALNWWARGIHLTQDVLSAEGSTLPGTTLPSSESTITAVLQNFTPHAPPSKDGSSSASEETMCSTFALPAQPPQSPAAQRTLIAALLSVSAYCSKRKDLPEAKRIEEHAIVLIEAMVPTPEVLSVPRAPQSPGQTLHYMYLMQRKSVLAVHRAEVTYSMTSPSILTKASPFVEPLTDLLTAASSSEVVAQVLTGLSHLPPDVPPELSSKSVTAPTPGVPLASSAMLAPRYRKSPWLQTSARAVLRDARLTAAEAWDLAGILYGELGESDAKALECFERALAWVGEPASGETREGISVNAWHSLWERYAEARARVVKK